MTGAVVIAGLTANFLTAIAADERIDEQVAAQVSVVVGGGVDFAASDDVAAALDETGLDEVTTAAIVEDYESAQLLALKTGLLVAAALALLTLPFTRELPGRRATNESAAIGSTTDM